MQSLGTVNSCLGPGKSSGESVVQGDVRSVRIGMLTLAEAVRVAAMEESYPPLSTIFCTHRHKRQ